MQLNELKLNQFKVLLTPRARTSHKGDFGHVLIAGGDYGMPGAVRLAGDAALRVGAGLVTLATRPEHICMISTRPELICYGINQTRALNALLQRATVIAIGAGLGQSTWSQQLYKKLLTVKMQKVVDADGLNLLAKNPVKRKDWILTPHPGEAARLLNSTTETIQHDRIASIKALQKKYGGIIVLKGAGTLVLGEDNVISICNFGNPGMASAGMGDVLTGIISGLLAQGLTLLQAAQLGVCLHAIAGDIAAKEGERGLLASDLILHLRKLINRC